MPGLEIGNSTALLPDLVGQTECGAVEMDDGMGQRGG